MKNIFPKILLLAALWTTWTGQMQAQNYDFNNIAMQAIADDESTPGWVTVSEDLQLPVVNFWSQHGDAFGLSDNDYLMQTKTDKELYRFQMIYNGVKVENIIPSLHADGEMVRKVTGPVLSGLNMGVTPSWTLDDARQVAITFVDANIYMWEDSTSENELKEILQDNSATYYPNGELVLTVIPDGDIMNPENYKLAWFFKVYAQQPISAQMVFIDALNGSVIKTNNLISNCAFDSVSASTPAAENTLEGNQLQPQNCHIGTANTLYDLTQSITTENRNGAYRLYDACRPHAVYTKLDGSSPYDADNIWTTSLSATSAHWAAEQTHDYYLQKHGRLSYDDASGLMTNNVVSTSYDNAFWNGYFTTYWNGSVLANNYLVSLDVVGHEWTHAVTQYAFGLVYAGESGCLNESFSDIFGTMLDFFAGNGDYKIGEDMWIADGKLRDMSDPKSKMNPDTYLGQYWSTAVHNGSGVPNHWFYLLAEGSSATDEINDFSFAFSVSGIGRDKAAAIAYRCLTIYMTPNSNFADARQGTIEAAKDLFGNCSNEVIQTAAAWDAVNVHRPSVVAVNVDVCGNFDGNTNPNVYIASQTLRAGNVCPSGFTTVDFLGTLVMKAGNSVELHPGFWAQSGSYFHANIMTCYPGSYLTSGALEIAIRSPNVQPKPPTIIASTELTVQPNPFQDFTVLKFTLTTDSQISLMVFDSQGRLVNTLISNEDWKEGSHSIQLNSSDMSPGIYYCRLQEGSTTKTCKLVVLP